MQQQERGADSRQPAADAGDPGHHHGLPLKSGDPGHQSQGDEAHMYAHGSHGEQKFQRGKDHTAAQDHQSHPIDHSGRDGHGERADGGGEEDGVLVIKLPQPQIAADASSDPQTDHGHPQPHQLMAQETVHQCEQQYAQCYDRHDGVQVGHQPVPITQVHHFFLKDLPLKNDIFHVS